MFEKVSLENGVRLLGEKIKYQDTVSIGFFFNTGSINETEETNGYSHFIEHMLFKGTKKYSAYDIVKQIEGVGGMFNAFTSRHFTAFYISILSTHIDRALDILTDIAQSSVFDEEELKREKNVICEEIRMSKDIPEEYVSEQFFKNFYKGHPLSRPIAGTIKTVKSVNRKKVIKYFKENFTANNLYVSVAGKFDFDYVCKRVSEMKLNKGKKKKDIPVPKVNYGLKTAVRENLNQVYFCLVKESFKAGDERNYLLTVINNILGAGSSSRLFQSLREKNGLCYSVYSYNSSFKTSGSFEIHASTSIQRYAHALSLIDKEIENIRSFHLSNEEISDAKAMYKGALAFNKTNADFIMSKNAKHEIILNKHFSINDMYKNISGVTQKEIKKFIEEMFESKRFFLSAVGPIGTDKLSKEFYKKLWHK